MYTDRREALEKVVTDGIKKKYYRFRPAPFYGGIATADCVGCVLSCVFCWSGYPRDHPQEAGEWYTPEQVTRELVGIARKKEYNHVRISGNEPTIGKEHLLQVLDRLDKKYMFILETSGVLIDEEYAHSLSEAENVHVRVSLKGTCESEFGILTQTPPEGFRLQLQALKTLVNHNVSCHPAAMVSFSSPQAIRELKERLQLISPTFYLEEEQLVLYPLVKERLQKAGFF